MRTAGSFHARPSRLAGRTPDFRRAGASAYGFHRKRFEFSLGITSLQHGRADRRVIRVLKDRLDHYARA